MRIRTQIITETPMSGYPQFSYGEAKNYVNDEEWYHHSSLWRSTIICVAKGGTTASRGKVRKCVMSKRGATISQSPP